MPKRSQNRRPNSRSAFVKMLKESLWGGLRASLVRRFEWLKGLVVPAGRIRVPKKSLSRSKSDSRDVNRRLLTPEGLEIRKLLAGDVFLFASSDVDNGEDNIGGFTVTIDGAAPTTDLTVSYDITPVSNPATQAQPGIDYAALSGEVVIPAFSKIGNINVDGFADDVLEQPETVEITLTGTSDASFTLSTSLTVQDSILIEDEDSGEIQLTAIDDMASEVGGDNGTFRVAVVEDVGGSLSPREISTPTTISFSIGGSATNGDDYITINSTTILPAGASTLDIDVEAIADGINFDDGEEVVLAITGIDAQHPSSILSFDSTPATVTIDDPTRPIAVLSSPDDGTSISEGDAITYSVALEDGSGNPVSASAAGVVNIVLSGGSTVTGADFDGGQTHAVSFSAGQSVAVLDVTITDDDYVEGQEAFNASLDYVSGSLAVASDQVDATIDASDATSATISGTGATEGSDGSLTLALGASVEVDTTFAVTTVAPGSGDAAEASDYTIGSGALEIVVPANQSVGYLNVTTTDDSIVEADEVLLVSLTGSPSPAIPVTDAGETASLTIVDDDDATLTITDVTVDESQNAVVSFALDNEVEGGLTLDYSLVDGTANAGSDFTGASGSIVINGTSGTLPITIDDDITVENDEAFALTVTSDSHVGTVDTTDNEASITILDNDSATVALQPGSDSIVEDATVTNFAAVVDSPVDAPTTVTLSIVAGSADSADYVDFGLTTAVIPAGQFLTTVPFTINEDDAVEGNETVIASIIAVDATPLSVASGDSATMTIIDDDSASIALLSDNISVAEDGGYAVLTLSLTGEVQEAQTINYTLNAGSATSADYLGTTGAVELTGSNSTAEISISIVDDDLLEGDESFTVSLSKDGTVDPSVTLGSTTGTVTILDEDNVSIDITPANTSVTEDDTSIVYVVTRTGEAEVPVTVTIESQDGSTSSGDYDSIAQEVVLPAGTSATSVSVTVAINEDGLVEADETFTVSATSINAGSDSANSLVATSPVTATIIDDDQAILSLLGPASANVNEDAGTTNLTLSLSTPSELDTSVTLSPTSGDASSSADYSLTTDTVVIPAGSTAITVPVAITDDGIDEANESLTIDVAIVETNGADVSVATDSQELTIVDDDNALVSVDPVAASVSEGSSYAVFNVSLAPSSEGVTVTYSTQDGDAVADGDYTSISLDTVFIPAGNESYSVQQVSVAINNDTDVEADEDFSLNLVSISGGNSAFTSAGSDSADVTILDNDSANLTVLLPAANEGAGVANVTLSLDARDVDTSVVFQTSDVSLEADSTDFTAIAATTTVIPAATSAVEVVIPVTLINDNTVEDNETFLFLASIANADEASVAVVNSETVTITDDDTAVANISRIADATEDGLDGAFRVTLTNPVEVDTTISIAADSSDAVEGVDYTSLPSEIVISAGETSSNLIVNAIDDSDVEGDEDVVVSITAVESSIDGDNDVSAGPTDVATLTLEDNDFAVISVTGETVEEDVDTSATFTVSLSNPLDEALTVPYSFAGSATNGVGDDYEGTSGSLTFTIGEQSKTVVIAISDDNIVEGDENVSLVIGTPNPTAGVSVGSGTDVIIEDDDSAVINILAPAIRTEGDGQDGRFLVYADKPVERPTTVTLSFSNDSAVESQDYTVPGVVVTIPANSTNPPAQNIDLPILDDDLVEGTETITATLSSSLGVQNGAEISLGTATTAKLTILNDDTAEVEMQETSVVASEGSNYALIPVSLSAPSDTATTVSYSSSDGTATSLDYDTADGAITIAASQTVGTISIALTSDAIVETDETFAVTLTAEDGNDGVSLGSDVVTTVTIQDDDDATVSIAANTQTISETGGVVVLTFDQTLESSVDTTLTYSITGGEVTADDFDPSTSTGTVVISQGETTATLSLTANDDSTVEGDEVFQVAVTSLTGNDAVSLPTSDSGDITIIDSDSTTVSVPTGLDVDENAGVAVVTIALSNPAASDLTVPYSVSNVSTENADFDGGTLPSGNATISTGETTVAVTVSLENDNIIEPDEIFTFDIGAPTGGSGGISVGNDSTSVTIDSEDEALLRVLTSGAATATFNEGDSTSTLNLFTFRMENPSESDTTVTFAVNDVAGSATPNSDYTEITTLTATISAGLTETVLPVEVLGDTYVENDEIIQVSLVGSSNSDVIITDGLNDIANATLANDDGIAEVSTSISASSVEEGTDVTLTISLDKPIGEETTVSYTIVGSNGGGNVGFFGSDLTSDGSTSATSGDSLFQDSGNALGAGTLNLSVGQQVAEITIDTIDDIVLENTESFTVSITDVTGVTAIDDSTAVATPLSADVTDNDFANIVLTSVEKGREEGPVKGQFRLILTSPTDQDITVGTSTDMGPYGDTDAQPGVDFSIVGGDDSQVIPAGALAAPVEVEIVDDSLVERTELGGYNLDSIMANPYTSLTLGGEVEADVTIVDNDAVTANVVGTSVVEDAGFAVVQISLATTVPDDVTVYYETADGSAVSGSDYTSTTGSVVIPATMSTADVSIAITDDSKVETLDETFSVNLLSATAADVGVSLGSDGLVTITDDDSADVNVSPGIQAEEGSDITVTLSLLDGSDSLVTADSDTTVTLGLSDLTAEEGSSLDYSAATLTAVIPANSSTVEVKVATTNDDSLFEGGETLLVTPLSVENGNSSSVVVGDDASVEILDNEAFSLDISSSTSTITEDGSDATVTVTVDQAPLNDIVVQLSADGTDITGDDFSLSSTDVTISAGETEGTVLLSPGASGTNELDETLNISIAAVPGVAPAAVTGLDDSTPVVIEDVDTPNVFVGFTTSTVEEGDSTSLTISLDQPATHDFTLAYNLDGSTATEGSGDGEDYTIGNSLSLTNPGSFVISAGETGVTLPLDITDDNIAEVQENLTISLTNVDGGSITYPAVLADPSTATLTIIDNDDPLLTVSRLEDAIDPDDGGAVQNGRFLINRSSPFGLPTTVTFSLGGEASSSDVWDYTTASTTTAVIPANQLNAIVTITPVDDGIVEEDQTVEISLESFTSGPGDLLSIVATSDSQATLTIEDQDTAVVSIGVTDESVTEGANSFNLDIATSKPVEGGFTLDLSTVVIDNNGTDLDDHDLPTSIAFPSSSPGATTTAIQVPVDTSDDIVEADETLSISAAVNATADADYGTDAIEFATVSATIQDSEDLVVIEDNDTLGVVGTPIINGGDVQRSRVSELTVELNGKIDDNATNEGYFDVVNKGDMSSADISVSIAPYDMAKGTTTVTITFNSGGTNVDTPVSGSIAPSLIDGNYKLVIDSSLTESLTGKSLGSNYEFGESTDVGFYRLYGDLNGDRTVNAVDISPFLGAISSYMEEFDFNGDGTVNSIDISQFLARIGTFLPF